MRDEELENAATALLRLSCRGAADVAYLDQASIRIAFDERPAGASYAAPSSGIVVSRRMSVPEVALCVARLTLKARRMSAGVFPDPDRQTRDAFISASLQFEVDADWHEMMVARELIFRTDGAVRASLLKTSAARRYFRIALGTAPNVAPTKDELQKDSSAGDDVLRAVESRWRKGRSAHLYQAAYVPLRERWDRAQEAAMRRPGAPLVRTEHGAQARKARPARAARPARSPRTHSVTASIRRPRKLARESLGGSNEVSVTEVVG